MAFCSSQRAFFRLPSRLRYPTMRVAPILRAVALVVLLPGCPTDEDDDGVLTSSSDTMSIPDSSSSSSSGEPGGPGESTGGSSSGAPGDSSGGSDSPVDPQVSEACEEFCAVVAGCGKANICDAEFCEITVDVIIATGEGCTVAYTNWVGCVVKTPCEDWGNDVETIPACSAQMAAFAEACF